MARIGRIAALVLATATLAATAQAAPRLTGEEQLAKLLAGRTAGTPVNCISTVVNSSSRVIDKTAIVYGSGRTIYVQRPKVGAESLDGNAILVTRLSMPQLCSIDTVQLHDRNGWFWRGFVGLDRFVPYTLAPRAARN